MQKFAFPVLKILLFLLIVYSPFFLHLGNMPVRVWDEARLIANTLEMAGNGNYLVPHFQDNPDMWNTKPPLMIWFQLLMLKIAGNQELAFRLPSAIAGLLTATTLLLLFSNYLKSYWFGILTVLILVTSNGYIGDHVTRTGDYDALLTLFTTFFAVSFFLYTETGKQKFLHFFFAGIVLAVFTKSVQGLLFLPALLIYLLISGNFLKTLRNKWVYIDFMIAAAIIAGYYLLRESVNPGYLEAVYVNELGGRYLETTENHRHEFMYYMNLLADKQFGNWIIFVPIGIFTGLTFPDKKIRNLSLYTFLLGSVYLLIISSAGTKLAWYDAPLYPLLAILAALPVYRIFGLIAGYRSEKNRKWLNVLYPALFVVSLYYIPYQNIIHKVYKPHEEEREDEFYSISHVLQRAVQGKNDLNNYFVCYTGYDVHLQYYTDQLMEQGKKVRMTVPGALKPGDKVIYAQDYIRKKIEEKFQFVETDSFKNVKFITINGTRDSNN